MRFYPIFTGILLLFFLIHSCVHKSYQLQQDNVQDGKYDSEFSAIPVADHLDKIVQSVHMISILAFYESFEFTFGARVTKKELIDGSYNGKISSRRYFQRPSTGTATVIYYTERHIALLTCEHLLDAPDTLIAYHRDSQDRKTHYIRTMAIKSRQNTHIIDIPQANDFKVLAVDEAQDIAIIGKQLEEKPRAPVAVFNYPAGRAGELQWGTNVYLIAYPRGKKMISTSLVSDPDRDKTHSFLLNTALPRGVSGGIVLAIRDGVPNFELVGMVNAISAESRSILIPFKKEELSDLDRIDSYEGEMLVSNLENIFYGVTYSVSIESVLDLIRRNEKEFKKQGFYFSKLFSGSGIEFKTN